jgi:undecaprenyl diphosphate synthase
LTQIPKHIAIIMDGNGRWAKRRLLPRYLGHQSGLKTVRTVVEQCAQRGVEVLTLFAFSSENWSRPRQEVRQIMDLFFRALRGEIRRLQNNQVRLRVIGDRTAFSTALQQRIAKAEQLTSVNNGLLLQIAANYGGRWDITQAARYLAQQVQIGKLEPEAIDETAITAALAFPDCPYPDLLIRTGGEQRISNFLLWQLAYAELYFSDLLWPDFNEAEFAKALEVFASRQRRFGKTGEQIENLPINPFNGKN